MAKLSKHNIHVKTAIRFAKKVGIKDHKRRFTLANKTWVKATANREGHPASNWKSIIQKAAKSSGRREDGFSTRKRGSKKRSSQRGGGIGSRLSSVDKFLRGLGKTRRKKHHGRGKPRKDSYAATKVKLVRIVKQAQQAQARLENVEKRRQLTMKEKADKKAAKATEKAAKQAHKEVSVAQAEEKRSPVGSHWGGEAPSGWGAAAHAQASHNDQESGNRYDGDPDRRRHRVSKGTRKRLTKAARAAQRRRARTGSYARDTERDATRKSKKRSSKKRHVTKATRKRMSDAAKARWRRGGKKKGSSASKRGGKRKSKKSSRDYSFPRFY